MRSRRSDNFLIVLLLLASACTLLAALSGCGANAKQKALRGAMLTLDVAKKGLDAYSLEYQTKIVSDAKTKEEARQKLDAFRARRAGLYELLITCYKAIGTAALDPSDLNVTQALSFVKSFLRTIEEFKHLKPDAAKQPPPEDDPDEEVEDEFVWTRRSAS